MTKNELNGFRSALQNRKAELESRNRSRDDLAIETSPDELDRIQDRQERELAIGTLDRNSTLLREVRAAISSLFDQLQVPSNYDPTRFSRKMRDVNALLH